MKHEQTTEVVEVVDRSRLRIAVATVATFFALPIAFKPRRSFETPQSLLLLVDDSGLLTEEGALAILKGQINVVPQIIPESSKGSGEVLLASASALARTDDGGSKLSLPLLRKKFGRRGFLAGSGALFLALVACGGTTLVTPDSNVTIKEGDYLDLEEAKRDFYNYTAAGLLTKINTQIESSVNQGQTALTDKEYEALENLVLDFVSRVTAQLHQVPGYLPRYLGPLPVQEEDGSILEKNKDKLNYVFEIKQVEEEKISEKGEFKVRLPKDLVIDEPPMLFERNTEKGEREYLAAFLVTDKKREKQNFVITNRASGPDQWTELKTKDGGWDITQDGWRPVLKEDYGKVFGPGELRVSDLANIVLAVAEPPQAQTTTEKPSQPQESGGGLLSLKARWIGGDPYHLFFDVLNDADDWVEVAPETKTHSPDDKIPLQFFVGENLIRSRIDVTDDVNLKLNYLYGYDDTGLQAGRGTIIPIFSQGGGGIFYGPDGIPFIKLGEISLPEGDRYEMAIRFNDVLKTKSPPWLQQFCQEYGEDIAFLLLIPVLQKGVPFLRKLTLSLSK